MPAFQILDHGPSRSFPADDPFRSNARSDGPGVGGVPHSDVLVHLGLAADAAIEADSTRRCVLIELGTEGLGVHTGEDAGREGDTRIGFARWQVGHGVRSNLVEVVTQPRTDATALEAARALFEDAGFQVAVCLDRAGRILDRMLRPYFNDALRALDDGLASGDDLDKTVRLGLGYPEGPIALLHRTGLAHHHDVTKALFDVSGERAFASPRRAAIARSRSQD